MLLEIVFFVVDVVASEAEIYNLISPPMNITIFSKVGSQEHPSWCHF